MAETAVSLVEQWEAEWLASDGAHWGDHVAWAASRDIAVRIDRALASSPTAAAKCKIHDHYCCDCPTAADLDRDAEIARLREAITSALAHRYGDWTDILSAALTKGQADAG